MRRWSITAGAAVAALALAGCAASTAPRAARQPADAAVTAAAPIDLVAAMDCLRTRGLAVVSAHRGGYGPGFPENAVETFGYSASRGLVMLETDVRQTRDRTLVLMHDQTLERTTTGTGDITQQDYGALTKLLLKDGGGAETPFGIPLLSSALEWGKGGTVLKLDIKRGVDLADVVTLINRMNAQHRVVVIVYTLEDAIRLHRLDPDIMMSVSIDSAADLARLVDEQVDLQKVLAFTGIRAVQPELNALLRERGIEPIFGTVGRPEQALETRYLADGDASEFVELVRQGVAIIATGRPIEAHRALVAAGLEGSACLRPGG